MTRFERAPCDIVQQIISGGQTGADRAALDVALALGIPHGGWVPRGRWTEDGPLPPIYQMQECRSADPSVRTRRNVQMADATLIIAHGSLSGGSALTRRWARAKGKHCLAINLERWTKAQARQKIIAWLQRWQPAVLNVAGPRASRDPLIYQHTYHLLLQIFDPRRSK